MRIRSVRTDWPDGVYSMASVAKFVIADARRQRMPGWQRQCLKCGRYLSRRMAREGHGCKQGTP